MKTIMMFFALLITSFITAQETAYWVGGTPGRETNWHVARNWSNNQIPDVFTNVIIKRTNSGHNSQPVISEEAEALSIKVYSGATLTVLSGGAMLIDGGYGYSEGISIENGQLVNNGLIEIRDSATDLNSNLFASDIRSGAGRWIVDERDWTGALVSIEQ